jgi:hypothetical protein
LSYAGWHTVAMDVSFFDGVDTSGGQVNGNDVVKIYVDGSLVHTGTTWESYYFDCVCQVWSCFFRGAKRLRFFQR